MHLGHQHVVGMGDFRVVPLQRITLKCFFLLSILLKLFAFYANKSMGVSVGRIPIIFPGLS